MVPYRKSKVAPVPMICPLTECLRLIGGTWTPHILWYLGATPRRFSELKGDVRGVSAKMLTTRLRELEEAGVVSRRVMRTSPPTVEYALTELGRELTPAIQAIVDVGRRLKEARGGTEVPSVQRKTRRPPARAGRVALGRM